MATDALISTGNLFLDPLFTLWNSFVLVLPSVVLALLLVILGYFIAWVVGYVLRYILDKAGVDRYFRKSATAKRIGHTNIPSLAAEIVKWFVFLIFLQVAVDVLNLRSLSAILDSFVRWLPNLLVAVLIFIVGVALAHYVAEKIRENTRMKGMRFMAGVLKVVIMLIVTLVGLRQIGVDVRLLEQTFLLLVGALALGIALAVGIGFGLGMKKESEGLVKKWKKRL